MPATMQRPGRENRGEFPAIDNGTAVFHNENARLERLLGGTVHTPESREGEGGYVRFGRNRDEQECVCAVGLRAWPGACWPGALTRLETVEPVTGLPQPRSPPPTAPQVGCKS